MANYFESLRNKMTGTPPPPPAPQGQQQQNPSQQDPNQQQQSMLPGGGSQTTGNPTTPPDPLGSYHDLYTASDTNTPEVPSFKLDPDKLGGVAKAQDFMAGLDPALMQKIQSGDMSALGDIIQHATRNAYKSALEHGSTLTDKYVGARFDYSDKGLGNKIREAGVTDSLSSIPGFSNPVARQELVKVAKQLALKHPDASPADIAAEARRYLTELGNHLNPDNERKAAQQKAANVDWDAFMSSDTE